jgi:hypothetical protein
VERDRQTDRRVFSHGVDKQTLLRCAACYCIVLIHPSRSMCLVSVPISFLCLEDLSGKGIRPDDCQLISEIVAVSKNLSKLNLSCNPLCGVEDDTGNGVFDPQGVISVCNAIKLRSNAAHIHKTLGVQPIVDLSFAETCLCNLSRHGDRMHRVLFHLDVFKPLKAICEVSVSCPCLFVFCLFVRLRCLCLSLFV